MFRKHFSTIVFLSLLIVGGALSGVFWVAFSGLAVLPTWLMFTACCTAGIAIAVLADPVERALTNRYEDRQRRQAAPDFRIDEADQR